MSHQFVYNRRLLKLADFLEKLPPKRFDYTKWVGDDWKGKQDLSCGTTGCALGWAATMPEFRRLGLRLKKDTCHGLVCMANDDRNLGNWAAENAIAEVFGRDSRDLFHPSDEKEQTATPKQVAKKIRKYVKENSK